MIVDDVDLKDLQKDARDLFDSLSSTSPCRPLFVEFAGTPKSGKSTCIDIVYHFFRRLGFKVLAPTEGASKRTPYYLRQDLVAFNAWSAIYALSHILEGRHGSDKYHLAIMDRGLFDALAWFEFLKNRDDVSTSDCLAIRNFFTVAHWRELVDIVFLFETDPATSLERENSDKLIKEPGQAMNPKFLEDLNRAYKTTRDKYSIQFNQFHVLNTSGDQCSNPQSTAYEVAWKIIEQTKSRVR